MKIGRRTYQAEAFEACMIAIFFVTGLADFGASLGVPTAHRHTVVSMVAAACSTPSSQKQTAVCKEMSKMCAHPNMHICCDLGANGMDETRVTLPVARDGAIWDKFG